MAYNATYDSTDIDDIVIDFIGTYAVQFIAFASLIALLVIFLWLRSRGGRIMPRM